MREAAQGCSARQRARNSFARFVTAFLLRPRERPASPPSRIWAHCLAALQLDLEPYMAQGCIDGGPKLYSLYAVVVHIDFNRSTDYGERDAARWGQHHVAARPNAGAPLPLVTCETRARS